MKNSILIACLMMIACSTFGQCKFTRDEVDEHTKQRFIDAKPFIFPATAENSYSMELHMAGDELYITLELGNKVDKKIEIKPGDFMVIKLVNDSVLNLPAIEAAESKTTYVIDDKLFTQLKCYYTLTKEQLLLIAGTQTKSFKINSSVGSDERILNEKEMVKFQEYSKCLTKK